MEVMICVPLKTDMSAVEREYPDIYEDHGWDDHERYFVGSDEDEEWLTYDEAVACCGFVEGAIAGGEVLIEGNGGWAQGMISRLDFSSLAISPKAKRDYKVTSNLFWKHFRRGRKARSAGMIRQASPKIRQSAPR